MLIKGGLNNGHGMLPYTVKPMNLTLRMLGKLFEGLDIGMRQCPPGWRRKPFKKDFNLHHDPPGG